MSKPEPFIHQAECFCEQHKLRLTPPRRAVLHIIAASPQPIGAYQILEKLRHILPHPKPPTVYRAISFWQQHGFIHRVESLNAYIACHADHRHQGGQFMICDDCGVVIETHVCSLPQPLAESAAKHMFRPTSWHVEIHGICHSCQSG